MSTERIDVKNALERGWVNVALLRGDGKTGLALDVERLCSALAQERSDAAALRERIRLLEQADGWIGVRVGLQPNCIRSARDMGKDMTIVTGTALSRPVLVEQDWLPVKWDDEDDPDWCKVGCIQRLPESPAAASGSAEDKASPEGPDDWLLSDGHRAGHG
jgi:hypothetical protein